MSCSGTSIIWFCFSTAGSIVIQVYSRGPVQQWWQFSFIFIKSGKHIYLYGFSPVESNVQSNYFHKYAIVQLKGTVFLLELGPLNSKSLALLLTLRPSAGFFACKVEVWLQLNTKKMSGSVNTCQCLT